MIEGMHFDISSAEMLARAAFHRERASFYSKQQAQFETAPTAQMTADPVAGLKEAGKRHVSKAEVFQFMRDHLVPGETYRLGSSDLAALEFIAERVW